MSKVAFFVDGAFFFRQVIYYQPFYCTGPKVREYCEKHLELGEQIFRIYYYDAEPIDVRKAVTPLGKEVLIGGATEKRAEFYTSVKHTPFTDLRLGKLSWHNDWLLTESTQRALATGKKSIADLQDADFLPNLKQKIVDMKIGMDIAKVAYKKLAERIVLVTGDSDFVPAARLARGEGLCVTIDPMGVKLAQDLIENVDYVKCVLDEYDIKIDTASGEKFSLFQNPKSVDRG